MSSGSIDKSSSSGTARTAAPHVIEAIRQAVGGIRFGSVEILIHEGRVVQIERREKVRWNSETSFLTGQEESADRIQTEADSHNRRGLTGQPEVHMKMKE